jgi:hypothetical protein
MKHRYKVTMAMDGCMPVQRVFTSQHDFFGFPKWLSVEFSGYHVEAVEWLETWIGAER